MKSTMLRPNLKDYSTRTLRARFAEAGIKPFRAEQIAQWLYVRGVEDPREMTDLDQPLRERLASEWETRALTLATCQHSIDGTLKAAFRARDGAVIEAVVIPEGERRTLCLSSQVGCPLACSFCATGGMGFRRNLNTAEMVDQFLGMQSQLPEGEPITNVVFMGMGEPLLNLDAVVEAVRIFLDPKTFAIASRRMTVSTAGVLPKIPELLEAVPVNLAVSLHATTDAVRDQLVPLNRKFPLQALLTLLRESPFVTRQRPVFFEYTLLAAVNDSVEDARRLIRIAQRLPAKVNVIPMNPHPGSRHLAPTQDVIDRFMTELARGHFPITLRRSRGTDIEAACGQLAAREFSPETNAEAVSIEAERSEG